MEQSLAPVCVMGKKAITPGRTTDSRMHPSEKVSGESMILLPINWILIMICMWLPDDDYMPATFGAARASALFVYHF